jgi:DNA-binding transcriptional LysR family regulator
VESLGAAARAVLDGTADLGITLDFASAIADLDATPMGEVELVPVAAPHHPLAKLKGKIAPEVIRDHVQLVLTDRAGTWLAARLVKLGAAQK